MPPLLVRDSPAAMDEWLACTRVFIRVHDPKVRGKTEEFNSSVSAALTVWRGVAWRGVAGSRWAKNVNYA